MTFERDQRLDQIDRPDFHLHFLGEQVGDRRRALFGEHAANVGEQKFEP